MIAILMAFTVFVWDNDMGKVIYDGYLHKFVGFEYSVSRALKANDCKVDIGTKLPDISILKGYDALFIVNGTRKQDLMDQKEIDIIKEFLQIGGKSIYIEGNNVVEFFGSKFPEMLTLLGVKLSEPTMDGLITEVIGAEKSFLEGEKYSYSSEDYLSNDVDVVVPGAENASACLFTGTNQKAYWSTAVGYAYGALKATPYTTLTSSVVFGGIYSFNLTDSEKERAHLMKKYIDFLTHMDNKGYEDSNSENTEEYGTLFVSGIRQIPMGVLYSLDGKICKNPTSGIYFLKNGKRILKVVFIR